MKLYTHPGASSLHVHILLREIGEPFDLEVVNLTKKIRPDGSDYRGVAQRGMVPMVELDEGGKLTENVVVAQYVCDRAGREDLMPAAGSMARYRVMEWQSFVATELHKSFGPLYWKISDEMRVIVVERINTRLAFAERDLKGPYLTGDTFTAADAYFFVIASWTRYFEISLDPYPRIAALLQLAGQRPTVRAALKAEGHGLVSVPDPVPVP
ncbi:glutathione binding-like protein (plasmid) [Novosphingobium resinovorum]|uniref:glutathione S-transferase family protein n=1 Tax=Novosphingobium TaxID=165696 RepID=UPI001B3C9BBC|nr:MULTISPECIES: glutathione S-transferase family protein [Novosphingobium]MBF7015034.1 glutathione S-transferase family protein [Novosphingobium sp. HR1a]WJM29718.1 glutathione binding-like protein [Novosphingobium resinovorum]